ncbi:MAG TPA: response regulator [Terriglobales bacterium]|nr:response regulator [Terriglobales bacterium]
MTASIYSVLHADPALAAHKKRVLLVDSSRATRDLRSETMRRLGADVDCAADISEARCWWKPDFYNLVLMNVACSKTQTDKFCDDIRRLMPQQQIMFLVGGPDYIAIVPREGQSTSGDGEESDVAPQVEKHVITASEGFQRWGILEACRRISAVRSKMEARSRAMRDLPGPRRDAETSRLLHNNEIQKLPAVSELPEETQ